MWIVLRKGEGLWEVTRICNAGITITAVMERIHYALRSIRKQVDRAGSWQRHYVGVRCMVSTPKGSNHVRDVPFTYIFMHYFPNHPYHLNPTMKREGFKHAAEIYLVEG